MLINPQQSKAPFLLLRLILDTRNTSHGIMQVKTALIRISERERSVFQVRFHQTPVPWSRWIVQPMHEKACIWCIILPCFSCNFNKAPARNQGNQGSIKGASFSPDMTKGLAQKSLPVIEKLTVSWYNTDIQQTGSSGFGGELPSSGFPYA